MLDGQVEEGQPLSARQVTWRILALTAIGFILAGLINCLFLLIGGRNSVYGLGWTQWNYIRWMSPYWNDLLVGDVFYLLFLGNQALSDAAWLGAMLTVFLEMGGQTKSWVEIIIGSLGSGCLPLLLVLQNNHNRFGHYWWPVSTTISSHPLIHFFEIGTTTCCLVFPFFLYLISIPLWHLHERHDHRLQPTPPQTLKTTNRAS